ncbi:MAG: 50S ribosomal protein L6 [Erysipelothrix sp.]|nr:50S ribosomal protein L6 [Erysipelothrix sp.]
MSRIGNKLITVPAGVEINISDSNEVTVKGPKGTLSRQFKPTMSIEIEDGILRVVRADDSKINRQLHGTTRSLINNMIEGVTTGFKKDLEIVGIGYRASLTDNTLQLNVGYSHPVLFEIEEGLSVTVEKNTKLSIEGIDKQRVGEFAAIVRASRKPEPYGGKGVRYKDEQVRRKEGKTAK